MQQHCVEASAEFQLILSLSLIGSYVAPALPYAYTYTFNQYK